jgi:hypothetical protein
VTALEKLTQQYVDLGYTEADADYNARRELRMTEGDPYAYRTDEELEEMRRLDAEAAQTVRDAAGVCDEFPVGEFPVPGYNC